MATSFVQQALALLTEAVPIVRASQYMTLSGFTLLMYDYCLTFSQEVELIWKAPPSPITIIYLVNRYLTPLLLTVDIYDRLGLAPVPDVKFCEVWVWLEGYLTVFSFMSIHGLVAMRVHALFGGRFALKVVLWVCWTLYSLSTMLLLGFGLWHGHDTMMVVPFFNVCYEDISPMLWTVWIPSLLFESLLFFLTTFKAIQEARRNIYHPISSILFRDGILYFIAIAVASLLSMFVWLLGSSLYEGLAKYWATAVINVAGCRLVLSLKTTAHSLRSAHIQSTDPGQSSSFLIGAATEGVFSNNGYIDLESDVIVLGELPQLGTIYPEQYRDCWEAI